MKFHVYSAKYFEEEDVHAHYADRLNKVGRVSYYCAGGPNYTFNRIARVTKIISTLQGTGSVPTLDRRRLHGIRSYNGR